MKLQRGKRWIVLTLCWIIQTTALGSQFINPEVDAEPTVGFVPLVVNFNCYRLEDRLERLRNVSWNFGDGCQSTEFYPRHIYTSPGQYTVTFSYQSSHESNTVVLTQLITVYSSIQQAGLLNLTLLHQSHAWQGEGWDNAIDRDTYGRSATTSAGQDAPWAIFGFADNTTKTINKIRVLVDTGIESQTHWLKQFQLLASTTGIYQHQFTQFLQATSHTAQWETFQFTPVAVKYIKMLIDQPSSGYRQIGELEFYEPVPNLDLTGSCLTATGTYQANGLDSCAVTITLADKNGNPITGLSPSAFRFAIYGGENFSSLVRETTTPGVYQGKFTSFEPGLKTVKLWVYNRLVASTSPFTTQALNIRLKAGQFEKPALAVVDGSPCYHNFGWENAFDGDIDGDDAMVVAGPQFGDGWVIFKFQDESQKNIQKFRIITDTGYPYPQDWVKHFLIQVSTNSLAADSFKTVFNGRKDGGGWEELTYLPIPAKYVKLVIWLPIQWKVLGEFEIYVTPEGTDAPAFSGNAAGNWCANPGINLPQTYDLSPAFPNPFTPGLGTIKTLATGVQLRYQLPEPADVHLAVFNLLGQKITDLVQSHQPAGFQSVSWDGLDAARGVLPAGIYFCRLEARSNTRTFQKIVKLTFIQ
ncbi:PKD domain-containing protein [candidate division KSB1 bacterium]|nr:PKD domain-containing protein [candidate division KSB1 bacterium]